MILVLSFLVLASLQDDVEKLLDTGYAYYHEGLYSEAIQEYDKAIKIQSDNPEIYFLRGIAHHGLENVRMAVEDLEMAIQLNPDYLEAHQELGYIYLVGQAPKDAIAAFDKALNLDPTAAEIYVNRGTAKCMLDNATGAREDWDKAMALGVSYSEFMVCD